MFSAVVALATLCLSAQTVAPLAPEPAGAPPIPAPDPNALKWDAESKEYHAKPGEMSAAFTFAVTNVSKYEVAINRLSTSCGCTVAQLPTTPYKLQPGSNVSISVSMDLHGKFGAVTKTVSVDSSAGFKSLLVKSIIPQPTNNPGINVAGLPANAANAARGDRAKNIQTALADRQAVFKGDCRSCHVDKGVGKMGKELYIADCAICHDPETFHNGHRAAMVPDLKIAKSLRDLSYWQKWTMEGKAATLMPAFASAHGGPLTQQQIDSLVIYCYENFPKSPLETMPVNNPKTVTLTPPGQPAPRPVPPTQVPVPVVTPPVQKN